jgi:hypothetical protein
MAALSGKALAMWLVLLDSVTKAQPAGPIWIAESITTTKYAMSPYTRQKALRELDSHGLIAQRREFVRESFSIKSSRTVMTLNLDRLVEPPHFKP